MTKPSKALRGAVVYIFIIFTFMQILCSCSPGAAGPPPPELVRPVEAPADIVPVVRGDIKPIKVTEGIVVPYSQGLNFLMADAPIAQIYVTHGQNVEEGELLAELDTSYWQERLDGARAELEHLERVISHENLIADINEESFEINIGRLEESDEKAVALLNLQEFQKRDSIRRETQELERSRLQNRIDSLEAQKDGYYIRAPYSGVILSIEPLMTGDYPPGRNPYIYLADPNRLTLRCLTEQTSFFSSADTVKAVIGDDEFPIEIIYYTLEEQLAFYYEGITPPARFEFTREGDGYPGGNTPSIDKRVLIMAYETGREDVLCIPVNAAHIETASEDGTVSRQEFAYVDVNGVRERRDIRSGRRSDISIEVVDGLAEGELVYVD